MVLFTANLFGDWINLINKCRNLHSILLANNPNIYGDLNQLQNHDKLQNFNMYNTKISGDIANFAKFTTKNFILDKYSHYIGPSLCMYLYNCSNLYGDIQVFSSLDVSQVELPSCSQITGDISAFKNCTNLKWLSVNKPNKPGIY